MKFVHIHILQRASNSCEKVKIKEGDGIITINVPLIWKVREIIFFSGQNS
jgi:hypothetical protein